MTLFYLEDMIDVYSFRTSSSIEIFQEWFQVKEFLMEHLNNFNIIAGIQNFTALLKSKQILLPKQHCKDVKYAVTGIIFVDLDKEIQSSFPKELSLLDHVQKVDHYIIIVLITTVVNKNSNFRHHMVLTVWFLIVTLVIDPTKEATGNVFCPLISFTFIPSINWTYVISRIMNTQAINIGRRQVIVRSVMFTFEYWLSMVTVTYYVILYDFCAVVWTIWYLHIFLKPSA